jgi:hypothetical protein
VPRQNQLNNGVQSFQCQQCLKNFSREDHLRRHELNHDFPSFLCQHQSCGMRFHRRDILRRHQAVHSNDPRKRCRKPRRDLLPPTSFQMPAADDDLAHLHTAHMSASRPSSMDCVVTSTDIPEEWTMDLTDSIILDMFPDLNDFVPTTTTEDSNANQECCAASSTGFPFRIPCYTTAQWGCDEFPPNVIVSCISSFRQHVLPRFPFIHETSIDQPDLPVMMRLNMAALGALHIDRYRGIAKQLHKRALQQTRDFTTAVVCKTHQPL